MMLAFLVDFKTIQSHIFRMHFAYYEYLTNFKSIASAYKLEVSHTRYSSSILWQLDGSDKWAVVFAGIVQ